MSNTVAYPYLPKDKQFCYVPHDHAFMRVAKQAREELAGDSLFPVGIALVKNGTVLVRAGNGFNRGSGIPHVCPRVVLECPSGTGYELCSLHDAPGHAEHMAVAIAKEQGIDLTGADAYMYGHWWACESCWKVLLDAGVRDVYVTDDAHERFSRDAVFAETLKSSLRTVYMSGALSPLPEHESHEFKAFYEALGRACEDLGVQAYVPHVHSDPEKHAHLPAADVFSVDTAEVSKADAVIAEVSLPSHGVGGEIMQAYKEQKPVILLSKKGTRISRFVLGNPAVVYHIEYEGIEDAARMLKNVIKQL